MLLKVRDEARGVINDVKRDVGGLGGVMGSVGKVAGGFLAAQAIAGGASLLTGQIGSMVSGASSLNESLSKSRVVFGEFSGDIIEWADDSATSFGQSKQQALEAAGTYGNLFRAFGIGLEPARDMSTSLVELAADLASFNNTSVDDALLALRSGLSGETEPLKRFGVAINDARLRDEALRMGLIKTKNEAMDPAAKAQAAYALIMKDTALAQGDFDNTSQGLANQQRILSALWTDLKTSLGMAILPLLTIFIQMLTGSVVPALSEGAKHVATFAELIGATLSGDVERAAMLFNKLPAPLQQLALWLANNRDEIEHVIRVARALAQDVLEGWIRIFRALGPVLADFARYLSEHKPLLIALAIALGVVAVVLIGIPALILAIIVAGGLLAAHWDEIKAKALEIWNSIPGPIQDALKMIYELATFWFAMVKNQIETTIKVIRDIIVIVMALIRGDWGAAWDGIKQLVSDVWNGIVTDVGLKLQMLALVHMYILGLIRDVIAFVLAWIGAAFADAFGALKDFAGEVWGEIKDAIVGPIEDVIEKIKELIEWIDKIPTPGDIVDGARGWAESGWNALTGNARGGSASGWRIVGEEGPELAYFGDRGGRVYNNQQTRAMGGGSGAAGITIVGPVNVLGGLAEGIAALGGLPQLGGAI